MEKNVQKGSIYEYLWVKESLREIKIWRLYLYIKKKKRK